MQQEYKIHPETKNSVVQRNTIQLRKDGFSASWIDGVLLTNATRGQIAMSTGDALWLAR